MDRRRGARRRQALLDDSRPHDERLEWREWRDEPQSHLGDSREPRVIVRPEIDDGAVIRNRRAGA